MDNRDWKLDIKIAVLEIDGAVIRIGLFNQGSLIDLKEYNEDKKYNGQNIVETAMEILHEYGDVNAIGISTGGQVDSENGIILYANSNIPEYTGMEVGRILEEEFKVPVAVENDVNASAIGEAHYGAGIGFDDFLCLTYGMGVGGAIVLEGDVYRGSSFSAGEVGAMIVHPEERRAKEDMYSGCYEKYASAGALVRKAAKLDGTLTDIKKIFAALERADVKGLVDDWTEEVISGLVSLIHILNPSCVILGGSVMKCEYVFDRVKRRVTEEIMESYRHVMITQAALGDKAGLFGIAYMALKRII